MSTDKMWWEESESVIGLMYAYRESKDPLLLKTGLDTYAFLKKYIMNPAEEWNWKTQADGTPVPVTDPYDPLKCPYHSVRLATACIPLLEELTQEKT